MLGKSGKKPAIFRHFLYLSIRGANGNKR